MKWRQCVMMSAVHGNSTRPGTYEKTHKPEMNMLPTKLTPFALNFFLFLLLIKLVLTKYVNIDNT